MIRDFVHCPRFASKWPWALHLISEMKLEGLQPDRICLGMLAVSLSEAGRGEEALRFIREDSGTMEGLSQMLPGQKRVWGPAMAIFAVLAAVAVTPSWPVWFWYHPAAMLLGYVVLMGNATLVKKIGGLRATKIHGYLMGAASVAAAFGPALSGCSFCPLEQKS
eukprot:g27358.t1